MITLTHKINDKSKVDGESGSERRKTSKTYDVATAVLSLVVGPRR